MSDNREATCAERIASQLRGRLEDLELLQWGQDLEREAGTNVACLEWEPSLPDDDDECENCGFLLQDHLEILEQAEQFESMFGYTLLDDDGEYNEESAREAVENYPLCMDSNIEIRIQLSTGGPGDEFLVTCDDEGNIGEIRYRFLDWFDGATVTLSGSEYATAEAFCQSFVEYEVAKYETHDQRIRY